LGAFLTPASLALILASGDFWQRFGKEVYRLQASLHRSERMLDCRSTLAHGLWVCIKALLHSLEQMRMLPARNPAL
jgi:hypothetical protein